MKFEPSQFKIKVVPGSVKSICELHFVENLFSNIPAFVCESVDVASGSDFLDKIFQNEGIKEIYVRDKVIILKGAPGDDHIGYWKNVAKDVKNTIIHILSENDHLISEEFIRKHGEKEETNKSVETSEKPDNLVSLNKFNHKTHSDEDVGMIKKLLKENINPALAGHGGSVKFIDFVNGYVFLEFMGGCQGCSMIDETVKMGIEKLLVQKLKFVKGVKDVTNHDLGTNPYYKK